MRLNRVTLTNFRCFEHLEIDLHEQLTVLVAPNGGGKTSVLDAARIALWPFVKGFDLGSQPGKSATIQVPDVRRRWMPDGTMEPQVPASICSTGEWNSGRRRWQQSRESVRPNTNTLSDADTRALTGHGKALMGIVLGGKTVITLPLISYLGTSRLWFEGRFTSEAKDVTLDVSEFSRTSGYLNCLSYSSSFKTFTAWYGWVYRSYRETQSDALEGRPPTPGAERFETIISVVKAAINALVQGPTGWRDLEYRSSQNQQLVMQHDTLGLMPVEDLSDGLRNAIAMVADLAYRACKLNPHLGVEAARETPGVVLIDEVDMFLHPSWQQTILGSLQSAFPKIQFIVTTHSPQVLSTVSREHIRVLTQREDGQHVALTPDFSPVGHEAGDALARVMGTHPHAPWPLRETVQQFELMVRAGQEQTEEARALRTQLEAAGYQIHDSDLSLWRLLARRRAAG